MITAEELKAKVTGNQPVTIIDVRSSEGYAASNTTVKGAIHFKVQKAEVATRLSAVKDLPKDREIVTYCACPKDEVEHRRSADSAGQRFQARESAAGWMAGMVESERSRRTASEELDYLRNLLNPWLNVTISPGGRRTY